MIDLISFELNGIKYLWPVAFEPSGAVVSVARFFLARSGTNQRRADDFLHLSNEAVYKLNVTGVAFDVISISLIS